jgi:tRNA(fMet)-specific endonuclease VapC
MAKKSEKAREKRISATEASRSFSRLLDQIEAIMRVFGEIDARLAGRGRRLPTSDLLIGSTALVRGEDVLTGNLRHFRRIPGLKARSFG